MRYIVIYFSYQHQFIEINETNKLAKSIIISYLLASNFAIQAQNIRIQQISCYPILISPYP